MTGGMCAYVQLCQLASVGYTVGGRMNQMTNTFRCSKSAKGIFNFKHNTGFPQSSPSSVCQTWNDITPLKISRYQVQPHRRLVNPAHSGLIFNILYRDQPRLRTHQREGSSSGLKMWQGIWIPRKSNLLPMYFCTTEKDLKPDVDTYPEANTWTPHS